MIIQLLHTKLHLSSGMEYKINNIIYLFLIVLFAQACSSSKKQSIENLNEFNNLSSETISIEKISGLQTLRLNSGARPMMASIICADKININTSNLLPLTHIDEYKKNAKWFTNSYQSDEIHDWLVKELVNVHMAQISENEVAIINGSKTCNKIILIKLVLEK